jgi:excisionase family DNA binding protein
VGVAMADSGTLTVPEVAARLRVSEWTAREWLRTGRLRGYRPGGPRAGWRVREQDLDAFITARLDEQADGERSEG